MKWKNRMKRLKARQAEWLRVKKLSGTSGKQEQSFQVLPGSMKK